MMQRITMDMRTQVSLKQWLHILTGKKVQKRSGSRRNYVAVWKEKHKTI